VLIATLTLSAAFLVDVALPLSWAIVEAPALLAVSVFYCRDLLSSSDTRRFPLELGVVGSPPLKVSGQF
jgi:hypothetical protein